MSKHVLILSGPTHEYIDPVRFIGNSSSGRMGKALAEEAVERGFLVRFITGPVADANLPNLGTPNQILQITSAEEMLRQAEALFQSSDLIIFAAAVADYAPAEKMAEKMAKSATDLVLRLRATPDIAKTLCATKRNNQIAIGFALQTHNAEANARQKLKTKNLNGIVLNSPATLGADNGTFSFLGHTTNEFDRWGYIDKKTCAKNIFQQFDRLG